MAGLIGRVKMRWSGFTGGPGLSVFHFGAFPHDTFDQAMATTAVGKVDAFIQALKPHIPYQSSLETLPEVEVLDISTGELQGILNVTPATAAGSTQSLGQLYTAAQGAVINWKTNDIRNGRRMRGRTFLVPLGVATVIEQNGTLGSGFIASMNTAAAALRSTDGGSNLMVYGRPTPLTGIDTDGPQNNADGVVGGVISHSIPDKPAVLRSRRD